MLETLYGKPLVSAAVPWVLMLPFATNLRGAEQVQPKLPAGYVEEAPLPVDYPPPGPVGEVIEKQYPVTRSYSAAGDGAFMECFAYLAAHHHKMTAPVVVEYKPNLVKGTDQGRSGMPIPVQRMHFLLERNSLDEPKEAGTVQVADIPPLRVLSIAQRGPITMEEIKAAQNKLSAKLKSLEQTRSAGQYRILGYNSPMIPREKNFWEVQLPIEDSTP